MEEDDYYRNNIIELVNGITRLDLLIYLFRLIGNIVKAGI